MVDHTRVSRDREPYRIRFRSRISSSLSPRQMLSLRQYIMQEQMSTRNMTVTWRGKKFIMEMNSVASLKDLEHELQKLTDVKADTMRLIVPEASNKSSKFLSPFSEEHSNTRLRLQEISFSKGKFIRMMGVPKDYLDEILQNAKANLRIAGFEEVEKRMKHRMLHRPHGS